MHAILLILLHLQTHLSEDKKLTAVKGSIPQILYTYPCHYFFYFIFYFYLYIYPPDSQESNGGAIHRVGNYPDLLPEMQRYCFR